MAKKKRGRETSAPMVLDTAFTVPGFNISFAPSAVLRGGAQVLCVYKDKTYSRGSRLCQEGRIHVCTAGGVWSRQNERC